jgi:hydrogenase expression/formation protein HypC
MCLAVPGRVVSIDEETPARMAKVSFGGVLRDVSLLYVPEADVGQYVIVHVGVALSVLDEEEAAESLRYFSQMAELRPQGGDTP